MRKILTVGKWILFLILLIAAVAVAARITGRKASERKYADLYAADNADVLFLGSSHLINAVNPVQLYQEYGIASYNLGGHGSILPATYYELLCALDVFSPQLVVVDCYMMDRDYHYDDIMTDDFTDEDRASSVSQLHLNLDVFPLSRTKLHAVRDLISDQSIQMEFLFPFITYHSRWSELEGDDFVPSSASAKANHLLGAEIRMNVAWQIAPHTMGDDELSDEPHMGEQYLQMILQTCRERGIDVALTFLPCNSTAVDRQMAARMEAVAQAEGIPALNMLEDDPTDLHTDYNDEGHLNLLGMTRTTDRIGSFLRDAYALPDRRGNAAYQLWADRAAEYDRSCREQLSESTSLTEALLLLAGSPDKRSAVLYLSGSGKAVADPAVLHLTDALAPGNTLRDAPPESPLLLVLPSSGEALGFAGYQVTDWEESAIGPLEVIQVENFTGVYLHHDESDNLLNMDEERLADAQLILLSADGSEIEEHLIFNYPRMITGDTE